MVQIHDEDRFKKELNKSYRFPSPDICIIVQINDVERLKDNKTNHINFFTQVRHSSKLMF